MPRAAGQPARVEIAGLEHIAGTVRLVSPEVDKSTRLGRVRIFLGDQPGLRPGSFARGLIDAAKGHGLAVPASAVLYGPEGPAVQVVREARSIPAHRPRTLGGRSGRGTQRRQGGRSRDRALRHVLRDGDAVRPVPATDQAERGEVHELEHLGLVDPQPVPSLVLFMVLMALGYVSFG